MSFVCKFPCKIAKKKSIKLINFALFVFSLDPGIAKDNKATVTKCDSKTYETSFPMRGATLGLPNTIRLL